MTSLPPNLVLDSQPRFGLTKSDLKFVAKCLSLQSPSSEFKDNLCNPIPLIFVALGRMFLSAARHTGVQLVTLFLIVNGVI